MCIYNMWCVNLRIQPLTCTHLSSPPLAPLPAGPVLARRAVYLLLMQ